MKVAPARLSAFLRQPPADLRLALVYGPDQGMIREYADRLARSVVDSLSDPFRVVDLSAADLRKDPARLGDEAAAMTFGGGRRVIRLRDAGDGVTKTVEGWLATPGDGGQSALVVVEGGELGPRSSLRRLAESTESAAAIACYPDEGDALERVIVETLRERGLSATPDALAFLGANLGADRRVTRGELDKLILYMGEATTVELADAMACVGDSAAASIDAVIYAAADGRADQLDRAVERALSEGTSPVALLRAVARHFQRLHLARAWVDQGRAPDQAMGALRPPVIFKHKGAFRGQMTRWNPGRLARALDLLVEAEMDCKTTGMPQEAVCGRALLRLAQAAARPR